MKKMIVTMVCFYLCSGMLVQAQEADESSDREAFHKQMEKEMVDKIDTNKDGQFDLSEFLAHAEERFNRIDANGDGYITREEGKTAHLAMRKKHHRWSKKRKDKDSSK